MSVNPTLQLSTIEEARKDVLASVNDAFDTLAKRFAVSSSADDVQAFAMPTLADGHDPRNKNGLNLTARGIEILYRVFDDDGGYNRAAKMLGISQGAAKNRKALWQKAGGKNRRKDKLDIDPD